MQVSKQEQPDHREQIASWHTRSEAGAASTRTASPSGKIPR
jgi:hypothetical protein